MRPGTLLRLFKQIQVSVCSARPGEFFYLLMARTDQLITQMRRLLQRAYRLDPGCAVERINQKCCISAHFRHAGAIGGYHRAAPSHRLDDWNAKAFCE